MGLDIESELYEGYIRVCVHGQHDSENMQPFVEWVAKEARTRGVSNVLVDLSALEGVYSEWDRFQAGTIVSDIWGVSVRAAIVYPQEGVSGFFENVAVNRGAQVRVMNNEQDALAWLGCRTDGSKGSTPVLASAHERLAK